MSSTTTTQAILQAKELAQSEAKRSDDGTLQWCELVDSFRTSLNLSMVDAAICVRVMVDMNDLKPVEGSALIKFLMYRDTSEYEQRQKALQQCYGNEARTLDIIHAEKKQYEPEIDKTTMKDPELRGRPRGSKSSKNRNDNK